MVTPQGLSTATLDHGAPTTVRRTVLSLGDAQDLVVDFYEVENGCGRALVLPGFGRTADEYFHLSAILLDHGISVLTPDFRFHPGRSAGAIVDFRMVEQAADITTILDRFDVDVVLASSLSFPPALRALGERRWTGQLVGIVPVMAPGATLEVVTGFDWRRIADTDDYDRELLLDIDGFEVSVNMVVDGHRTDMVVLDRTIADAERFGGTLTVVVGEHDSWVAADHVRAVVDAVPGSEMVVMQEAGHDFGRSVRRARAMFQEAAGAVLRARGVDEARHVPMNVIIRARQQLRDARSTALLGATG